MVRDPLLRWPGRFTYGALEEAGIGPGSTMAEILDASYELMARGRMTPEVRRAWDELRRPAGRLVVDFLLYDLDLPAEEPPPTPPEES